VNGKRYWFYADGNPYEVEALKVEAKNLNHNGLVVVSVVDYPPKCFTLIEELPYLAETVFTG
jgi:hypothetical protein